MSRKEKVTMKSYDVLSCLMCERNHTQKQPCPQVLARAFLYRFRLEDTINQEAYNRLFCKVSINRLNIIEEWIADILAKDDAFNQ